MRDIEVATLPNGVQIVTEAMPGVRSIALGLWIGTGSRSEHPKQNGVSHFIEHMLFKGSISRSAEVIARECDAIGGHLDAFTGRELVGFNMKVVDEHIEKAFDILADLLLHPRFDPAEVDKEKGVVLEELKMETDDPESLIHDLFVSSLWPKHPLGRPILGTSKTIRSFSAEALHAYHRRFYNANNLIITAAGNFRHEEIYARAARYFGRLDGGDVPELTPPAPAAPFVLKNKRSLHQVHFCLGVPMHNAKDDQRFASYLLNVILGGSMSSRLFQNIRERQGLAYSIFSELNLYRDTGTLGIYGGTSSENVRRVLESILNELRDLKSEPIGADEIRLAKDHMKGSLVLSLESTTSRMSNLARQWLYFGRYISLSETLEQIEAVTPGQIQAVAREFFRPDLVGLALLGNINGLALDRQDLSC